MTPSSITDTVMLFYRQAERDVAWLTGMLLIFQGDWEYTFWIRHIVAPDLDHANCLLSFPSLCSSSLVLVVINKST